MTTEDPSYALWRDISARAVTGGGPPRDRLLYRRLIAWWTAPTWPHDESSDRPDDPRAERNRAHVALLRQISEEEGWSQHRQGQHHDVLAALNRANDELQRGARVPGRPWRQEMVMRRQRLRDTTAVAVRELEEALGVGLRLRRHLFLTPVAVPRVETMMPWTFYASLHAGVAGLSGEQPRLFGRQPGGCHVCKGCTLIFRPRKRPDAMRCPLCAKRLPPRETAFDATVSQQRPFVAATCLTLGRVTPILASATLIDERSRPLLGGVLGLSPPAAPGESVVVRSPPEMTEDGFMVGPDWRTFAYATCAHCCQSIPPNPDKPPRKDKIYCDGECRQAAHKARVKARAK